jgi:hypothetical protein
VDRAAPHPSSRRVAAFKELAMNAKSSWRSFAAALLAGLSGGAMAAAATSPPALSPAASAEKPRPPDRIKAAAAPAKAMPKKTRPNKTPVAAPAATPAPPKTEPIDLGCTSSE